LPPNYRAVVELLRDLVALSLLLWLGAATTSLAWSAIL